MNPSSHDAGRVIAKGFGEGPSRSTLAAQRSAIIRAMQGAAQPRSFMGYRLAVAVAVLATALVAGGLYATRHSELSASLGGEKVEERAEIQAAAEGALEFSDGSRLSLEPRTRIALPHLSADRASIVLNDGQLEARIRKGTGRNWTIAAGPYSVRVVGTEFSLRWDRDEHAFAVAVREGKVMVSGGDLPAAGVALQAGERLERKLRSEQSPATLSQVAEDVPGVLPKDGQGPAAAPRASSDTSWEKLAGEAQYKRALESAERAGFERLASELGESQLLLLANTARYAGDSRRARMALNKLRARFPKGSAASLAALYLAGIAEDRDKNPVEAASWLSVYLSESPRGQLSAGARARLIAISVRQGNHARARQVARDYLKYHPAGPHAEQARAIVESAPK